MRRRGTRVLALTVWLALLAPATALAQGAWLPGKGEANVGFSYQFLNAGDHLFSEPFIRGRDLGSKSVDLGQTSSQVVVVDAEVGITDRLALSGTIAFISSRYVEGGIGRAEAPQDNGNWHGAIQDGRISARYLALDDGTWVLTPSISYGFPATDYTTLGHSALGRGLNELQLGLHWGRMLSSSGVPFGYLYGSGSHAFMEDAGDVSLSRTNVLLGFGYFFKSATLSAWTQYQNIHGGFDWSRDFSLHDENFEHTFINHDRTAATDYWRAGLTVSLPVSLGGDLYAGVGTTLWGVNTHEAVTFTVGATWNFQLFGGTDWWYE